MLCLQLIHAIADEEPLLLDATPLADNNANDVQQSTQSLVVKLADVRFARFDV